MSRALLDAGREFSARRYPPQSIQGWDPEPPARIEERLNSAPDDTCALSCFVSPPLARCERDMAETRSRQAARMANISTPMAIRPITSVPTETSTGTHSPALCAIIRNACAATAPTGMGSSYAPALLDSLKHLSYYETSSPRSRRASKTSAPVRKRSCPRSGSIKTSCAIIDDIYVYLKARSRRRPAAQPAGKTRSQARRAGKMPKTPAWARN